MELDTGAAVTIVPQDKVRVPLWQELISSCLWRTAKKLHSATVQLMHLAGEATVEVELGNHTNKLKPDVPMLSTFMDKDRFVHFSRTNG